MRIRRPWLVVVVLLTPVTGRADDHKADLFAAFSAARGSALFGGHVTLGVTSEWPSHDVSFLGDLSVHGGTDDGNDVTRIGFMGGVRYAAPRISSHTHRLFGQLLGGIVRNHAGASNLTDPAIAAGFGYEYRAHDNNKESGWAGRVQVEYVRVFTGGDSFPRASGGVVYRIGREAP